jgi:peptide deformylase
VVREVLRYPDPRLKRRAAPATGDVSGLVEDLVDTMRSFGRCVGIAAPQIGVDARVCVVDCTGHPKAPDASGLLVLVNPELEFGDETEVGREGCLSIPDLTGNVRRAASVRVSNAVPGTPEGYLRVAGFEARAVQHEVDHLDGVLFLDRVVSASDVFARKSRA